MKDTEGSTRLYLVKAAMLNLWQSQEQRLVPDAQRKQDWPDPATGFPAPYRKNVVLGKWKPAMRWCLSGPDGEMGARKAT